MRGRQASFIEQKESMSVRNGPRPLVRFPNGNTYIGDWQNDLMHGKGTLKTTKNGSEYVGEFVFGKKEGFGCLSLPIIPLPKKLGSSKESNTAPTVIPDLPLQKVYVGQWHQDKYHGEGTLYGEDGISYYQGQFENGMKHGFGREQNAVGDIYDGEWRCNMKHGKGMMRYANGDVFEGLWEKDQKHGEGNYNYTSAGRVYEGEWVNGVAKFGQIKDIRKEREHVIPEIGLLNPDQVIQNSKQEFKSSVN